MRKNLLLTFIFLVIIVATLIPQQAIAEGNDQPRVLVTNYELEDGGISPGKTNQLTITLKNMNLVYPVYSVLVTCNLSSTDVFTEYGFSNQVYVDSIQPNSEKQIVIHLDAADILDAQTIQGMLDISFKNDITGYSVEETSIYLPVKQEYLKIQRTYVPQTAIAGVKSRVSVTYENVFSEEVYNTVMHIKGSGMEETSLSLGTVLSENMKSQEIYIVFNEIGEQDISIEFTYEDPNGNVYYTKPLTYKVDVQSKITVPSNMEVAAQPLNSGLNLSIKQQGYIFAVVLCLIGTGFILIRKMKKH